MKAGRTHPRARSLVAGGLLLGLFVARPAYAQTPEAKAGARAVFMQGSDAFDQKRWADALDLFTRAESIMHAPTHVLMIGRSHLRLGHLVRAHEAFSAVTHETLAANASAGFKAAQAEAAKELKALEPRIPTLTVTLSVPNAKGAAITIDGQPWPAELIGIARPVDPGTHVLKARAERLVSGEKSILIDEGGRASIVLDMLPAPADKIALSPRAVIPPPDEPPPQSQGLKIGGFVGVGLGAAGVVVGAAFTALGFAKRGDANDAFAMCGPPCVNGSAQANTVKSLDSSANTKETIGLIGFVAGGALAATGAALVVVSSRGGSGTGTGLVLGPGSVGLRGSF